MVSSINNNHNFKTQGSNTQSKPLNLRDATRPGQLKMLACLCGHDCLLADAFAARQTLLSSWEINCVGRPYLQLHTYTSTSSGPMVLLNKSFSMICAEITRAYQTPLFQKILSIYLLIQSCLFRPFLSGETDHWIFR